MSNHRNYADMLTVVDRRIGYRFFRVAWGPGEWLEYRTSNSGTRLYRFTEVSNKQHKTVRGSRVRIQQYVRGSHVTQHDREARDWCIRQNDDGSLPKL